MMAQIFDGGGQPPRLGPRRRRFLRKHLALVTLCLFVVIAAISAIGNSLVDARDRAGVLTSDTTCTGNGGTVVDIGVQVHNRSSRTLTLTGATVRGLPAALASDGTFAWSECHFDAAVASGPVQLGPGSEQWVALITTLTATCPGDADPVITVAYTDNSGPKGTTARHTVTFANGDLTDTLPPCSTTGFGD